MRLNGQAVAKAKSDQYFGQAVLKATVSVASHQTMEFEVQ
jgi:hypothetical protein